MKYLILNIVYTQCMSKRIYKLLPRVSLNVCGRVWGVTFFTLKNSMNFQITEINALRGSSILIPFLSLWHHIENENEQHCSVMGFDVKL